MPLWFHRLERFVWAGVSFGIRRVLMLDADGAAPSGRVGSHGRRVGVFWLGLKVRSAARGVQELARRWYQLQVFAIGRVEVSRGLFDSCSLGKGNPTSWRSAPYHRPLRPLRPTAVLVVIGNRRYGCCKLRTWSSLANPCSIVRVGPSFDRTYTAV